MSDREHNGHGNGHAEYDFDPLAETLKLDPPPLEWPPPKDRRFSKVRSLMTGRAQPSRRHEEEPLTRVPGWLTGLACSALLLAFSQAGYLIYKLGHSDTVEVQNNREFDGLREDLRAQDQYNQLVIIYENKIQNILIKEGIDPDKLPPVPQRPTFHSRRGAAKGD